MYIGTLCMKEITVNRQWLFEIQCLHQQLEWLWESMDALLAHGQVQQLVVEHDSCCHIYQWGFGRTVSPVRSVMQMGPSIISSSIGPCVIWDRPLFMSHISTFEASILYASWLNTRNYDTRNYDSISLWIIVNESAEWGTQISRRVKLVNVIYS